MHLFLNGQILVQDERVVESLSTTNDPLNDNQPYNSPAGYNEPAEELWIDQNALSLMINRYNGTLVRGE